MNSYETHGMIQFLNPADATFHPRGLHVCSLLPTKQPSNRIWRQARPTQGILEARTWVLEKQGHKELPTDRNRPSEIATYEPNLLLMNYLKKTRNLTSSDCLIAHLEKIWITQRQMLRGCVCPESSCRRWVMLPINDNEPQGSTGVSSYRSGVSFVSTHSSPGQNRLEHYQINQMMAFEILSTTDDYFPWSILNRIETHDLSLW